MIYNINEDLLVYITHKGEDVEAIIKEVRETYDVLVSKIHKDGRTYLVVSPKIDGYADYRLAELFFQMNARPARIKGHLCPACQWEIEKTGEGEAFCGHLTFN
jgi:predicted  nucleic acid-binding Zn-ribbon protein